MIPGLSNVLRRDRERTKGQAAADGLATSPPLPTGQSPVRRQPSISSPSGSLGYSNAFTSSSGAGMSPVGGGSNSNNSNPRYGATSPPLQPPSASSLSGSTSSNRRPQGPTIPPPAAGQTPYVRPPSLSNSSQHSMLPEEHRAMERERERLARERLIADTSTNSSSSSLSRATAPQQQVPQSSSNSSVATASQETAGTRVSVGWRRRSTEVARRS